MTHGWDDAHQHLSQCGITHHSVREKVTCEVYCLQFVRVFLIVFGGRGSSQCWCLVFLCVRVCLFHNMLERIQVAPMSVSVSVVLDQTLFHTKLKRMSVATFEVARVPCLCLSWYVVWHWCGLWSAFLVVVSCSILSRYVFQMIGV